MKKIALLPNSGKDIGLANTKHIIEYISVGAEIYMPKDYSVIGNNVNYVEAEEIYKKVDIAIVLGGDGTIIQTATECAKNNVPVLGINLGTVGFMTEVEVNDIESSLDKLLNDDYKIEKRMMLKMEIIKNGVLQTSRHALNDVVISKTIGEKLINIELYTDGELVNKYIADGLIIATPTGSTGYSISAGGPVVDPLMQLYVATPICAHMLSVRSAVLSSDKEIEICVDNAVSDNDAVVTADGDVQGYISGTDKIRITKSKYNFNLIKTGKQSFYDTLLNKLS